MAHHAGDLLDARAVEVEAVAAIYHGRRDLLWLGGGEHEHGVWRRLLEGLQKGVPSRRREHVGLIEDVDLAPPADGGVGDAFTQLADVIDRVARRGVHLDHVKRAGGGDRGARLAHAAWLDRGPALAVQAGGEDLGHRGLAGAARADEQVGVVHLASLYGVAQRAYHRLLADDLGERPRAVPTVERLLLLGWLLLPRHRAESIHGRAAPRRCASG